jgi:hypothetical protein
MRKASSWRLGLSALAVLMTATMLAVPVLGVTSSEDVKIRMETSEDLLVMNSDVTLIFTVTDAETGDPIEGCDVVVHVDQEDSGGSDGDTHTHGEPMEVPDNVPDPSVQIEALQDPKSGWNLQVETTNFRFAPENASTDNVWGEGHAHLYIDDVKVGRVYTEWYHIDGLEIGDHTVRVTLNTNNHMDLAVDGEMVQDSVTITETREPGGHSHGAMPLYEVPDGVPTPEVELAVLPDPKSGWNVHMVASSFLWAPENASTEPVMGEGHAHLYVDGEKVARVYGEWYYMGTLAAGEHDVRVTLNANNHSDYAKDGVVIGDSVTVTVEEEDGHSTGTVTLDAEEGKRSGTYVVTYHFEEAGNYMIEAHVAREGHDDVAQAFEVEVLEGDPAPITIAGIILYVTLAIVVIVVVQYWYTRRKVRQLQEASRQAEERPEESP